jgi:hexosaminidase
MPSFILCYRRSATLLVHVIGLLQLYKSSASPRLFPAAKQERYDPQTHLLRTLVVSPAPSLFDCKDDNNPIIEAAQKRFQLYLQQLPTFAEDYPVNPLNQELISIAHIEVVVRDRNATYKHMPASVDESYQIQVDDKADKVRVESPSVFGLVRALESLAQLVEFGWMDHNDAVFVIRNTPLLVADKPTYSYRGLMIDTARHYLPLDLILSNLDVMAMNKLNVLHWHMTDDQSWPFQSITYPEISEKGAYHPKHSIYSHDDVQKVLDAALMRGIRVIPEFDLPGHSQVLGKSHPELLSQCSPGGSFAAPLDPTLPGVYQFVENLYKEITTLFPDPFIHVGGDEVNLGCWQNSRNIQTWAKAHGAMTNNQLLNYFESILTDIVAANDKIPIAWQELLNEGVDLPPGTIIDVWKGFDTKTIENATKRSYPVILSGCWYLDHLTDNWLTFYNCEPLNFNGTKAQKDLVMGGHASMWGERVDATNFMERVWPRASAVAERLWSGSAPKSFHDVCSKTVEARLIRFRCFMVLRGVPAAPIDPGTCAQEMRPVSLLAG